jgi:hypothetical protein
MSNKIVWDPAFGVNGSYLTVSDVAVAMPKTEESFINKPPTISQVPDILMYDDDPKKEIELAGISDGDGGLQTLTVTTRSSNTAVAASTVVYVKGQSTAKLSLTPKAPGNTLISVILRDNGGVANGGKDSTVVSFNLKVEKGADVRVIKLTVADGQWGADNRILGGKDCETCFEQWLIYNTGQGKAVNDNFLVNIPPRYTYAQYLRFDIDSLPAVGAAVSARLVLHSKTARDNNMDKDSIVLYALEDFYFPIKDFQGKDDQELDEFYKEGNGGAWMAVYDDKGKYLAGKERWITSDNAPGFNEGNKVDLTESWDFINHDVLKKVGAHYKLLKTDTLLTIEHPDIVTNINKDENGVAVFVLSMLPNPKTSFARQAVRVYSGEDYGMEPALYITWDKKATAVNNSVKEQLIRMYPNPASNLLNFKGLNNTTEISFYSVTGVEVMKVTNIENHSNCSIDISRFQTGIYMVRILNGTENRYQTLKFVKN